jgi:preprotein translocase subunit SecG
VAKTQLISVLPEKYRKDQNIFTKATIIFAIIWLIINFLFVIFETDASLVMGFLGSAVAYFFTYLIPITIIWKFGKTIYIKKEQ